MLVGKRGYLYSRDLSTSDFCIVPPGGDGWSSRVDDSVRRCNPVHPACNHTHVGSPRPASRASHRRGTAALHTCLLYTHACFTHIPALHTCLLHSLRCGPATELTYCTHLLYPPTLPTYSTRLLAQVRHGCIPVIIMDGVLMPFEGVLDYASFSIRIPEADVEQLDALLRAVPAARKVREYVRECVRTRASRPATSALHGPFLPCFLPSLPPCVHPYFLSSLLAYHLPSISAARQAAMRAAMATLWTRFTYAKSILQPDAWLPRPELPRDYLKVPPPPLATTCYLLPITHYSLRTTHYSLRTTHYALPPRMVLLTHYLEVPPLPALADLVAGGPARAPPRARPPRRRLLHGTAMAHEDGPALAPGSQPISGEAHAAPDALDTIIMFLAGRVDLS